MKLQLALDTVDFSGACGLLDDLHGLVDIVEIGTPLIFREGVNIISRIKGAYPELLVLADLKIMDAGAYEAGIAFEAGADMVTVLGVAHDETVQGAVSQGRTGNRQVMADLIAVPDPMRRAVALDALGVDYVCIHTATDRQGQTQDPLEDLPRLTTRLRHAGVAIAGGITPERMRDIAPHRPGIVIVGGFITRHPHPRQAAQAIRACFP